MMKPTAVLVLALLISTLSHAQFSERKQAFDGTIQLSIGTTGKDNFSSLMGGISGRRIPVSLTAGLSYSELDNGSRSIITFSTMTMVRVAHIDFRSTDFNLYGIASTNTEVLYEYGAKVGILANDRTRIYLYGGQRRGYIQGEKSVRNNVSPVVGVTFSLLFWNGYSGYDNY